MRLRALHLAGLVLLIAACASAWTVDTFKAPEPDFAGRRTYAWAGGDFGTPNEVDPGVVARADHAMRAAVDAELARKGYVLVNDAAQADMHLSYQVAGQRRFVIPDERPVGTMATEAMTPGGSPQPPSASTLPREQTVREGTVIVFIDDPKSKRLIWRGRIDAETRVATTEGAIEQAASMARQIAREVPPGTP